MSGVAAPAVPADALSGLRLQPGDELAEVCLLAGQRWRRSRCGLLESARSDEVLHHIKGQRIDRRR